ncbi:MAG: hypothetical protein COB29_00950 [Sulfitobacter sp.]|nr:MAG: hypothetical protein COB29_00950 [Sulfitobacter sp.]
MRQLTRVRIKALYALVLARREQRAGNAARVAKNPFAVRKTKVGKQDKRFMRPVANWDKALKDLYYKRSYFWGRDKLFEWFKSNDDDPPSRRYIDRWLSRQAIHEVMHGFKLAPSIRRHHPISPGVLSVDLKDMISSEYKGKKYILAAYDLFTKRLFATALSDKKGGTVAAGMKKLLDSATVPIRGVYSDNGTSSPLISCVLFL